MDFTKMLTFRIMSPVERENILNVLNTKTIIKDKDIIIMDYLIEMYDRFMSIINPDLTNLEQEIRIFINSNKMFENDSEKDKTISDNAHFLAREILFYSIFVRPAVYKEDLVVLKMIDINLTKFYNESLMSNYDLIYYYDGLPNINDPNSVSQLIVCFKQFFEQSNIKYEESETDNGNIYIDIIKTIYTLTTGNIDQFNSEDFIFPDINPLSDKFYSYLIERGILQPTDVLEEIQNMLAYVNISKKNINVNYEKLAYLRKYDVPLRTKISKEYLEKYIIPSLYDNINICVKFHNYNMFGMHNEIITYLIDEGYSVDVKYGDIKKTWGDVNSDKRVLLKFHDKKKENNETMENGFRMVLMNGNDKSEKLLDSFEVERYYKIFEFLKTSDEFSSDGNSIRHVMCETVTLKSNPSIFSSMMTHVMKNVYNFNSFKEIEEKRNEYVDLFSDKFNKIIKRIQHDTDSIIKHIKKRYDDSSTNIVEKFINKFKSHLDNYFIKSLFSVLIYGAPGTGKTYFAKTLARTIYGSEKNIFIFSLAQYQSEHFFESDLLGSAHGFVGYDKPTKIQKFIMENQEAGGVILFDEIDKTSTKILDILLNVLNDGELVFRGMNGTTLSVKKFIFIFCGNYNINNKSNITNLKNMSPAFLQRMKIKIETANGKDRKKIVSSVICDQVNNIINFFDKNLEIDIELDDTILNIPKLNNQEINGRNMNNIISEMFNEIISDIINIIKEKGTTNFYLKYVDGYVEIEEKDNV